MLTWLARRSVIPCLAFAVLLWCAPPGLAADAGTSRDELELFVSEGCPHCAAARTFLEALSRERPGLRVIIRDVRQDPAARSRWMELTRAAGERRPGVPTLRVGSSLIVGFDTPATTGARIRAALDGLARPDAATPDRATGSACEPDPALSCAAPATESISLPLGSGTISPDALGLPLFTVFMGLLDGLNPCSMWVLVLMISLLASLGDRRKMLAVAGTFVAVEGFAYFAFMAAWLNLFLIVGLSRPSEILVGGLAIMLGLLDIKDFAVPGRGPSLSIPAAAKPGIYRRLRAIIGSASIWPAILGAALLAIVMQGIELLCTSGFPALYTRILTRWALDPTAYLGYLALYNLMYMLDDLLILGLGVYTLSQRRLGEREGRWLKLLAGLTLLGLGIHLLMPRPS